MKLVIYGSRDAWPSVGEIDAALTVCNVMTGLTITRADVTALISGTAAGADRCGEEWAAHHGIPIERMPADWDRYGKRAGHVRNHQMARAADVGLGFWRAESTGTANMTTHLVAMSKPVRVVWWQPKK